ncbi:hypothetical protein ACFQ61_15600 [Streptomyces sp. NPDC056500]|uniref:hypothetical protein n=1 Tax=Streptomyces sp. NPDC056500 TaxID=3345840 RepID=UPI00368DABCF
MNEPPPPYRRGPQGEGSPGPQPEPGGDDYSATALGSHWFEGPRAAHGIDRPTLVQPLPWGAVQPDRVEGEVLRFGPGVTASRTGVPVPSIATAVWHGAHSADSQGTAAPHGHRHARARALRRYALAATVLALVLSFLAWQRYGSSLAVEGVSVDARSTAIGCDSTADLVAVVRTDGRPGTLHYRWVRSDGTRSGQLRETLARGQKTARLHLLWTFHGTGAYRASAELQLLSPSTERAIGRFSYACNG